jgi:D-alanyl-D-alanine carboxypeptidase (penicillin-binding protein 5/6)
VRQVIGWGVLFLLFLSVPAHGASLHALSAAVDSVLLLDMEEGRVLYAKNSEEEHAPASLVKLMTLYVALEDVRAGVIQLSELVPVSVHAATVDRYRMGLRAGEPVTLQTLLEGVAIASANDAAAAVAEALAGSEEAFVARMNAKGQELGLAHTRFANPHGLPGGEQYTTAADQARLTQRLLAEYPESAQFLQRRRFVHRGRVFERRFPLFQDPGGILALKTGYTAEAGYNLAVVARKGGKQLMVVVLGAETRGSSFFEAARLLNFGFRNGEPVRTFKGQRRGARLRGTVAPQIRLASALQLLRRAR